MLDERGETGEVSGWQMRSGSTDVARPQVRTEPKIFDFCGPCAPSARSPHQNNYEMPARKMHAHEVHAHEMHAREVVER
jgi:hypothetical protein